MNKGRAACADQPGGIDFSDVDHHTALAHHDLIDATCKTCPIRKACDTIPPGEKPWYAVHGGHWYDNRGQRHALDELPATATPPKLPTVRDSHGQRLCTACGVRPVRGPHAHHCEPCNVTTERVA